jgi:undecaprenyl-diphosphatase
MVAHHRLLEVFRFIGRHERGTLVVLLFLMVATLAFLELGEIAVEPMRSDVERTDPIGPEWFEGMVRDVTSFGGMIVQVMVACAVIGFLLLERKKSSVIGHLLKELFERPRPELISRDMTVFSHSFPSGHSMMAAATYLTLGALLARTQRSKLVKAYVLVLAILLTIAVGFSRVYLGVHWPTDVLAGWIMGASWALICWAIALRLQKKKVVEAPAGDPATQPA